MLQTFFDGTGLALCCGLHRVGRVMRVDLMLVRPTQKMRNPFTKHGFDVAVLALVSLTISASTAAAECVGFPLEHYKEHADLVFSGAIRELRDLDAGRTLVTFEVDRVWKGDVGQRVVLHQTLDSIDSFRFVGATAGKEYLVFASRLGPAHRALFELTAPTDAFSVPVCGGGTRALLEVDQGTLRQLGRARNPR